MRMKLIDRIITLSGLMFMFITSLMFYNHLYTAFRNPGFFTVVYFDYFGEGTLEIIVFTLFLPFIAFAIYNQIKQIISRPKPKKD